ncbi:MAG: response regulator, partial [Chthoniobacterales bacterium]|nr:response regulator [Chthoniobacterales bacterium]
MLHRDGIIVSVDDDTAAMFGYLATDLVGRPLREFIDETGGKAENGVAPCQHQAVGIRKDGTRFILDLISGCSCGARRQARAGQPMRVLVVEDDADTLHAVMKLLSLKGYVVSGAKDMKTALEMAHHGHFDLLLSDICLPDGTGWDLLVQLRGSRPIHAVAMSGLSDAEDIQRSASAGFAQHLVKPVPAERLDHALRST